MSSLRRGLTRSLWFAIAVVGVISTLIAYRQAWTETEVLLDDQMQQVAHMLAGQSFPNLAQRAESPAVQINPALTSAHDPENDLIAVVRDRDGRIAYASHPARSTGSQRGLSGDSLPVVTSPGFQTLQIGPGQYRLFAAQSNDLRVEIAQSMEMRSEAATGVALAALLPVGLLFAVLGAVMGLAIRRQLRPLRETAASVANRPPLALELLPVEGLPTEVRPLVDEINRVLGRLQTAMQREQRFVTDAAHALRTPLTALQLQADVLDGTDNPAQRAARFEQLRAGIRRAVRLSEQLLSLARSESATGTDATITDLDAALRDISTHYEAAAFSRGISLEVDAHTQSKVPVSARQLTLIVGNLLDNAVRYTPDGGHVEVRAAKERSMARIEVSDEGCGIPAEEIPHVFERFNRVSGDDRAGTGLGLATVESLLRQLGGRIALANRRERPGLVATVRLPLIGAALLAAAGCTFYHAKPLSAPDVEATLESPDRVDLVHNAEHLQHPMLPPVKLDFTKPLTGEEIEAITVLANPDLRALRTQLAVSDAQVFSSGLVPDPQFTFGVDRVVSPPVGYTRAYTSSVSFDILGALATKHVERQAVRETAAQLHNEIAWQEWSAAGQAHLLTLRLGYQLRAVELTRVAAERADRALSRALNAAAVGDLAGDEIQLRRLAATDARSRALTAARDADTTRLGLNHMLGLKPAEPLSLAEPPELHPWNHADPDQLFVSARERRLDLKALAHGYASQEASLHRAILGQYPRLGIAINRAQDTSKVITMGPAVSFDLPLWNRNRGAIAVAKADRTRVRAEFAARLHQTRSDIAGLVAGLDRDEQARIAIAEQMTDIERIAGAFEQAAAHHDVTEPAAEAARSAAVDKRIALLALEQSCAEQRIALALATGSPIATFLDTK